MTQRPISIVVADDHPVVLQGVVGVLRLCKDFDVVAVCDEGLAALQAIRDFVPDIAVLDVTMPKMGGIDVLSRINSEGYQTKVVFLSAAVSDKQIVSAFAQGVRGIIFKDAAADSIVRCIREVAAGQRWIPADIVESALEQEGGRQSLVERLTVREIQITSLISEGLSNKEIGRRLKLREGTIKIHLHNIYAKMDVPNRTALTALVIAFRDELRSDL